MTMKARCALSIVPLVLAACGGGGGGGKSTTNTTPTVQITSANAERVTAAAVQGARLDQGPASTSIFAGTGVGATPASASAAHPAKAAHAVAQATETFTEPCDGTGNVALSINDADNNLDLSAGDTVGATFNNCVFIAESTTLNGGVSLRVTTLSGEPFTLGSTLGIAATYSNLSIDGPGDDDVTVGGSTNLSISVPTLTSTRIVMSGGNLTVREGAVTSSIINPNLTVVFEDSNNSYSISGSSTVTNQALGGTVSFNIDTPFVGTGDADPTSGSMTITGVNSRLVATANNDGTVRLQIDETNDGSFDSDETVTWEEIVL